MYKIIASLFIIFALSGCIRKMNIEQGNVLTPQMVNELHPGMTPEQVKNIMGTPILTQMFSHNRVDYVYTYKPGGGTMSEKYITLIFKNNRLQKTTGNMYSAYIK